jgi:hypothetical protein
MGAGRSDVACRWIAVGGVAAAIAGAGTAQPAHGAQKQEQARRAVAASRLPAAEPGLGTDDVASLRTRTTQTFRAQGGSYAVRVAGESLNYRDALGRWQPIDSHLKIDGDHLRNGANRYSVSIPRRIGSKAVRVSDGDAWIEFAPQGASARTASLRGSEASFASVWPGVELRYAAKADSVKESLVVRDLASVRDFAFALRVPPGYTPVADRSGAVAVRDVKGVARLQLSRSTMIDAAGAMFNSASELRRGPRGWELVLIPDRRWLSDPSRKWPVTVDPTVTFGGSGALMCNIWKLGGASSETGSTCGANISPLIGTSDPNATDTYDYRLLLNYDGVTLPPGAVVEFATIDPNVEGSPPYEAFDFYEMTTSWNEYATWETSNGTTPWTGPGAQLDHPPTPLSTAGLADLVRRWASGETANYGLLMTRPDPNGCLCYAGSPQLLIQYALTDDPDGSVQQAAIANYQETDGLTAAEALRRLKIQDRFNSTVDDVVDEIADAYYGGNWVDDADAGKIKIGIETDQSTPPSSKTAGAREVLADHDLVDDVKFVAVDYSYDELEDQLHQFEDDLAGLLSQGKLELHVSPALNAVDIDRANSLTPAELSSFNAAVAGAAVRVIVTPVDLADLRPHPLACGMKLPPFAGATDIDEPLPILTCDTPDWRGGVGLITKAHPEGSSQVFSDQCTGAFLVKDVNNLPYILTAGHCVEYHGDAVIAKRDADYQHTWWTYDSQGHTVQVGAPVTSGWQEKIDAALIRIDPNTLLDQPDPPGLVYMTGNPAQGTGHIERYPIDAVPKFSKRALGNGRVCYTSATPFKNSPLHTTCGKVDNIQTSIGLDRYTNEFRMPGCPAQGGASGAPVFKGHRGYGMLTQEGFPPDSATLTCHTYFSKLSRAQDIYHVKTVLHDR